MKRRYTLAELEEEVSKVDRELGNVPHGNRIRKGMGPSRPLTFADHMEPVLRSMKQASPNARCKLDLDVYLRFWRDAALRTDPPETVPLDPERLDEKGRHLLVIPTLGRPTFRAAALHFEVEPIGNEPDLTTVRVCRPPQGYRKRKVLGAKVHYEEYGDDVLCYGPPSWVNRFIQDQRHGESLDRKGWLVSYLTDKLGWPADYVTHYIRDMDFSQP